LHFRGPPAKKSTIGLLGRKSTIGHFGQYGVFSLRKGEATRERILETTATLAAQKGLAAVSLAEAAEAVGLSKSALFKHFGSKEAMQLAVIDHIARRFVAFVWAPAEPLPPGRERLERIFERQSEWCDSVWPDCGCPIMAFSIELDDQPGPLRDALHQALERWRRRVVSEFKALRTPPLSDDEAQFGFFQMKSFLLGQSDSRRLMLDASARRLGAAAFRSLLDRMAQPMTASA
jgi:AcrR family transcriptional regulator